MNPRRHAPLTILLLGIFLFTDSLSAGDPTQPWKRHTIDQSSRGADGTRVADVNGDGLLDITTGWEQGGVVRVYLNPGPAKSKQPWPAVSVGKAGAVEDAVFADLDGDGALDVVSCSEGKTQAMWVHWAPREKSKYLDASAWTTEPIPAAAKKLWMFSLPAQIDGRNGIDLFAGAKAKDAEIGWWEAPEKPRQLSDWKWHPLRPAGWTMSLIGADMDSDGDQDLLFSDRKKERSGCFWLENPGKGELQAKPWKEHLVGAEGKEIMFLSLADLDGDGRQDVLAAVKPQQIFWFRRLDRNGDSWDTKRISMPENSGTAKAVTVGDLDLDGRLDIVYSCEQAEAPKQGVGWLSFTGKPIENNWRSHQLGGLDGVKHDLVELIDMDADGDLDVLTCEEVKNLGVFWYENPTK